MIKNRIKFIEEDNDKDDVTVSNDDKLILKKENKTLEYHIHLDQEIGPPSEYRNIFEILREAKKEDKVIFHFNTPGGWLDTMIQFFDSLLHTKAETKAVIYSACSAGAIIALCCDKIEPTRFAYMMIHSMDTGTSGKISDIHDYSQFAQNQNLEIIETVFQGFLTKQELQSVNKGKELWMHKDEILKRLENWKTIKQRKLN
jgi:ATP-dependent protease ClpP protease subunit